MTGSGADAMPSAAADRLVADAVALHRAGDLDRAAAIFEQALALAPGHPAALTSYAILLLEAGDAAGAVSVGQRAIAADPRRASARHVVGRAQCRAGRLAEGIATLRQALAMRPEAPEIHLDLGNTLLEANEPAAAERHLSRARELAPASAEVAIGIGNLYRRWHRPAEAAAAYRRAIELDGDLPQAHNNLGTLLADGGDSEGAIAALRRALALAPDRASTWSNLLLALNWSDRPSPAELAEEHRAYGRYFGQRIQRLPPARPLPPAGRRLRIGYVSSDFCDHVVALFILPLFAHHDRTRFEIHGFSNRKSGDATTERIAALVDRFLPVAGMSDRELAERIRADAFDVLVDLNGHTAGNRLPLFLLKPAPVQVTWLGYLGTTGLATMDYRLTDARADPPGLTESLHAETLWRLPDSLWCYEPYGFAPDVGAPPVERHGHATFASFSHPGKVSATVLGLWARILEAVPGARLLLMKSALPERAAEIARLFARRGVAPDRVEQLERRSTADYLALYQRADVVLDTWPCAGATTTCDALWMGVPVVALAGTRSFSRSGASLLASVGLPELVAEEAEDYVAKAVALARDAGRLAGLRATLRARMRASALTDGPRFVAAVERAFTAMVERASAGGVRA